MKRQTIFNYLNIIIDQLLKVKDRFSHEAFSVNTNIKIDAGEITIHFEETKITIYLDPDSRNINVNNINNLVDRENMRMMGRPSSLNGSRTCPRCNGQGNI